MKKRIIAVLTLTLLAVTLSASSFADTGPRPTPLGMKVQFEPTTYQTDIIKDAEY